MDLCMIIQIWYAEFSHFSYTLTSQSVLVALVIVIPDSKVHVANMGPTWVLSAPDGPHVGPMNFAIWDTIWMAKCKTAV